MDALSCALALVMKLPRTENIALSFCWVVGQGLVFISIAISLSMSLCICINEVTFDFHCQEVIGLSVV